MRINNKIKDSKKDLLETLQPWFIPIMTSAAMLLAIGLGLIFPSLGPAVKPYAKYNLSLLLLINALHINYGDLLRSLVQRPLLLIYIILLNNILLPLTAFALFIYLWPEALPAAILIAGVSSGFSSVSFAILLRSVPEINLLVTLGSSFLVPFTLPFLLYFLINSSVEVHVLGMMLQMSWMIFAPMVIERILFFCLRSWHTWFKARSHLMVVLCLSVSSFIVMASSQSFLHRELARLLPAVFWVLLVLAIIYLMSLLCFARSSLETQIMALTATLVKNSGLASVLALDYFGGITLVVVIVYNILWNFNIVLLRTWPWLRNVIYKRA